MHFLLSRLSVSGYVSELAVESDCYAGDLVLEHRVLKSVPRPPFAWCLLCKSYGS